MFNLNQIQELKIAELRQFCADHNITVEGIKTKRDSFLQAIAAFLESQELEEVKAAASEIVQDAIAATTAKVKEVATVENAKKGAMITARILWSIFLVSVAIAVLAWDLWKNRDEVIVKIRKAASKSVRAWQWLEAGGYCAVKYHFIDRVLNLRDRIALLTGAIAE